MTKTKIEWTEETWNPVTGCTKYSEGCQNCYAEKMHKRLTAMGLEKYKKPFNKVVFHTKELRHKHRCGNRQKHNNLIFVNSMSDTFHENITNWMIIAILTHCNLWDENNIFQILTKRAERLPNFEYPTNVWLGVTVEKAEYKTRIEFLKQTNAKIKFLSCEPLLEDLGELDLTGIDWVIVGGESGKNARPCHPDWVRNIQKQCEEQKVPFFFKQWGEYFPRTQWESSPDLILDDENIIVLQDEIFNRVGKSKAGALLDGKEYKEYPKTYKGE